MNKSALLLHILRYIATIPGRSLISFTMGDASIKMLSHDRSHWSDLYV